MLISLLTHVFSGLFTGHQKAGREHLKHLFRYNRNWIIWLRERIYQAVINEKKKKKKDFLQYCHFDLISVHISHSEPPHFEGCRV